MPALQWMSLQACFDRTPGTFPFTVLWAQPDWGTEDEPYEVTFVGREIDTAGIATWLVAEEHRYPVDADVQDMANHTGWATRQNYMLPQDHPLHSYMVPIQKQEEEVQTPSKKRGGMRLQVQEYMVRMHPQEWKQDQLYRKTIGHLTQLLKVSKNRYLELAISNAKSARSIQDPRKSQHSMRRYVLVWEDKRWPASVHGRTEVEYDMTWYPKEGAPKEEIEAYQNRRKAAFKSMKNAMRSEIKSIRRNTRFVSDVGRAFTSRTRDGVRLSYRVVGSARTVKGFQFSKPEYEVSNPHKAGYVHMQPGAIEWLMFRKMGNSLNEAKIPRTADKYVGIELEFFSKVDADQLGYRLFKAGVSKNVQLKHDGSIRAEDDTPHPHEICILAKEDEYEGVVQKVSKVLEDVGSKVNKSCGMHVHLDMRARDRDTVFANLVSSQNILYAMNPASRLEEVNGQRYCAYTRSRRIDQQSSRYHGINGQAFARHQTIEVRIHSGTFQARKIINWVKLLIHIANRTEAVARSSSKLRGFVKQFELPMDLAEYIVERIKKFADKNPANQEEAA